MDNTPCVLEILDTAGTEQFASMKDLYIKNEQGFVVVYILTNHQNFQDIKTMQDQIVEASAKNRMNVNKVFTETVREARQEGLRDHLYLLLHIIVKGVCCTYLIWCPIYKRTSGNNFCSSKIIMLVIICCG